MQSVAPRLLASACDPLGCGVFPQSRKVEGRRLLERIFNQNEQALGLFYLHPDLDVGIGQDALALLRVTVALRAAHYPALLGARRGRLTPAFQAKLGWLVANLYGRAASPDWADQVDGKKMLDALISKYIDDPIAAWVDDALMIAARQEGRTREMSTPELRQYLGQQVVPKREDQIADEAVQVLRKMAGGPGGIHLDEEQLKSFRNRLVNSKIKQFLRKPEI